MKKGISAIEPIPPVESPPEINELEWEHESEVHARGSYEAPESAQEMLQRLMPGIDLKRLVL